MLEVGGPVSVPPLPDFTPKPHGQRKIAVPQSDQGPHLEGIAGSVESAGALGAGAGSSDATAFKCRTCGPPLAVCGLLDRQHPAKIGLAAMAAKAPLVPGPARRTAFHAGYSR